MVNNNTTFLIKRSSQIPVVTEIYVAVCALLFTAMFFLTPYQMDDFWYINSYRDYKFGTGEPFRLNDGIESLMWHWSWDNGRLANLSTPITLVLFPKWVFNILSGFIIWATFRIAVVINSISVRKDTWADLAMLSCMVLFLPWHNHLFTADFCLNYEWSGLGMLYFIWLIVKPQNFISYPIWLKCIIWITLPFIGLMHEAAAACGLAVSFVIIVFDRKFIWTRIIITLFYATGFIISMTSVATMSKMEALPLPNLEFLLKLDHYIPSYIFYVLVIEIIICLIVKPLRRRLKNRSTNVLIGALFIGALASECIYQLSGASGSRVTYFGFLLSIIDIFVLICAVKIRVNVILSIILCGLSIVNMAISIYWQNKLLRQYKEVTSILQTTRRSYIPYDFIIGPDISFLSLGKPSKEQFHIKWDWLNYFYRPDKRISLIPTILQKTPIEEGKRLSGTPGARLIDKYIVIQDYWDPYRLEFMFCTVNYTDGSSLGTTCKSMTYFSGSHICSYLMMNQPRQCYFKTPVSIYFDCPANLEYIQPGDTAKVTNQILPPKIN